MKNVRVWSFNIQVRPKNSPDGNYYPNQRFVLLVRRDLTWGNRQMYVDKIKESFSLLNYIVSYCISTKTKIREENKHVLIPYENINQYFADKIKEETEYKPKGGKLKKGTKLQVDMNNPKNRNYSGFTHDYTVENVFRSKMGKDPLYILSYVITKSKPDENGKYILTEEVHYSQPYSAKQIFSWLEIVE